MNIVASKNKDDSYESFLCHKTVSECEELNEHNLSIMTSFSLIKTKEHDLWNLKFTFLASNIDYYESDGSTGDRCECCLNTPKRYWILEEINGRGNIYLCRTCYRESGAKFYFK